MAGVGHLKRIFQDAFRVAGAVQKTCSSEMFGGKRGCILGHQICRFAEMILRDRCSTSYDLASIFRGRRNTFDRWTGKIAKRCKTHWYEAVSSALNFPFFKDVSQNYFVFDVVKLKKIKKFRRSASFVMLSTLKNEEVSQICFVFDVVNFKK